MALRGRRSGPERAAEHTDSARRHPEAIALL